MVFVVTEPLPVGAKKLSSSDLVSLCKQAESAPRTSVQCGDILIIAFREVTCHSLFEIMKTNGGREEQSCENAIRTLTQLL